MSIPLTLQKSFFDSVRNSLFLGSLTAVQVTGMNAIYEEAVKQGVTDLRQIAYILATPYHETGATMVPVREIGKGVGKPYGKPAGIYNLVYYGRGYDQMTWLINYQKFTKIVGQDLVKNPDLLLDPKISAITLVYGMVHGTYTGVGLSRYIHDAMCDYVNARKIINGLDRAKDIAGYAQKFATALGAA